MNDLSNTEIIIITGMVMVLMLIAFLAGAYLGKREGYHKGKLRGKHEILEHIKSATVVH